MIAVCDQLADVTLGIAYSPRATNSDFKQYIASKNMNAFMYTNADPQYINQFKPFRGFHVIRDPRDIAISAYFSHKDVHPVHWHENDGANHWLELETHREKIKQLPFDDGLMEDILFTERLPTEGFDLGPFILMRDWNYERSNIYETRFEQLTIAPSVEFAKIFSFLGGPFETFSNSSMMEPIVEKLSFKAMTGRSQGMEKMTSHYRKGTIGDWKNYFKDQHKQFFKKNYGDLLIQLGYEQNLDW
jgi:hypothetical protein